MYTIEQIAEIRRVAHEAGLNAPDGFWRIFKQCLAVVIFALWGASANADIVSDVQKIESLEQPLIEDFYMAGESSADMTQKMRLRRDALEMRLKYPDAWRLYSQGEISEFSYFGFKLRQVEEGSLPLEKFLRELQQAIERWK